MISGHPINLLSAGLERLRRHIAVHEAGHAVIGLSRGLRVLRIDADIAGAIRDPGGGIVVGGTIFDAPDGDQNALARAHPHEVAVTAMAGICAEEVVLGCHGQEGWAGDLRLLRIGYGWTQALTPEQQSEVFSYLDMAHEAVVREERSIRALADEVVVKGIVDGPEIGAVLTAATAPPDRPDT